MPQLYVLVFEHAHGSEAHAFWFEPSAQFPFADYQKTIARLGIDFDPENIEESVQIFRADDVPTFTAEEIGGTTQP